MKMKEKIKREIRTKLSLVITIIGLLIIITGTSYAILRGNTSSLNEQVIKTGDVTLKLTEHFDNISAKIIPLEDSEGLLQKNTYEFNIKNIGSISARYDLSIINEVPNTYEGKVLPLEYIKAGLEVNGKEYGPFSLGELEGLIDSGIIYRKEVINYKLRLWLDKDKKEELETMGEYKAFLKIKVEAKQSLGNLDTSGANEPKLASSMIPVYYDSKEEVWRKADEGNASLAYKWYDYNEKMWANSVTYDRTKVYDESSETQKDSYFDGQDFINMGNENYNFNNQITVAARFYTKGLKTNGTALIDNTSGRQGGFEFYVGSTGRIIFQFWGQSTDEEITYVSTSVKPLYTWITAVATYDGTTIKIYIDGKLEATLATENADIRPSANPIFIGALPSTHTTGENGYIGHISDALVINDVLTEEEIKNYTNDNFNYIEHENTIFYEKYNTKSLGEENNVEYTNDGASFNGTNSYIDTKTSESFITNTISIGARIKIKEPTGTNKGILGSQGIRMSTGATTKKVGISLYDSASNLVTSLWTNTELDLDKYYNIVGTYDGKTIKIYVNGKLDNSVEYSKDISTSNQTILIGARNSSSGPINFYNGDIKKVFATTTVLTENEIKENYSTQINCDQNDNMLFYYNLINYENRPLGTEIPMDIINNMFVWIPRFKYEVWNYNSDGTKTSNPQEINIVFEKGTSSTGDIECTDNIQGEDGDGTSETCKINNKECTDETCNNKYYTHPAFTFGEEELTGFWIGKFEPSAYYDTDCYINASSANCNKSLNLMTKPNTTSYRYGQVSTQANNIMAMNDENNIYGFTSKDDTHMIKNMEWGAVSYLSHSKYGTCTNGSCNQIYKNNSSLYYSGRGGNEIYQAYTLYGHSVYTHESNKSSTTWNVYGVYDLFGGTWEILMSNMISPNGDKMLSGYSQTSNSGYTGIVYDGGTYTNYTGIAYPEEKYYDKYSFDTVRNTDTATKKMKLGDGQKETVSENQTIWYNGGINTLEMQYPWTSRGGEYNATSGSVFSSGRTSGVNSSWTTRIIVATK